MGIDHKDIGRTIDMQRDRLAEETVDRQYQAQPELETRYGPAGRSHCLRDTGYHLSYLSQAIAVSSPELFADYVTWVRTTLEERNVTTSDLAANLHHLGDAIRTMLPDTMHRTVLHYIDVGLKQCEGAASRADSYITPAEPYVDVARHYLEALLAADRQRASSLILHTLAAGASVQELYTHVFQRTQQEIGRLWQLNQVSVAQEHYCTAATQLIISQLYPHILTDNKNGHTLVATCVAGDLHELGIRMVADFFEMEGWKTIYLGANTPTRSIVQIVVEQEADILALSATMTYHVNVVADVIAAVRASEARQVKILVGGYPFTLVPDLWKKIGADAYAPDATTALDAANNLVATP